MKNINSVKIKLAILASLFLFFGNTYAEDSEIQVFSSGWAPTGIYRGQERWGVLSIKTSSPEKFFATDNGENQYFSHSIRGSFIEKGRSAMILYKNPEASRNAFKIKVTRVNRQDECTTVLHGILTFLGTSGAELKINGSDGRCDVPVDFTEKTTFIKTKK